MNRTISGHLITNLRCTPVLLFLIPLMLTSIRQLNVDIFPLSSLSYRTSVVHYDPSNSS